MYRLSEVRGLVVFLSCSNIDIWLASATSLVLDILSTDDQNIINGSPPD